MGRGKALTIEQITAIRILLIEKKSYQCIANEIVKSKMRFATKQRGNRHGAVLSNMVINPLFHLNSSVQSL